MREQDGVKEKKDLSTAQFVYPAYSNLPFHSIVAVFMKQQQHCFYGVIFENKNDHPYWISY
jgi:hypothetical protein